MLELLKYSVVASVNCTVLIWSDTDVETEVDSDAADDVDFSIAAVDMFLSCVVLDTDTVLVLDIVDVDVSDNNISVVNGRVSEIVTVV